MGANRREVLGHIDCPVCGFDMQVKLDKNDQASGYCPDCSQQLFTRTDHKSGLLIKRMRPVAPGAAPADAAPPEPAPIPVPVFIPKKEPAPKAVPASQAAEQAANAAPTVGNHQPAQKTAPAAYPAVQAEAPKPAAPRTPWFSPLLGNNVRKQQNVN